MLMPMNVMLFCLGDGLNHRLMIDVCKYLLNKSCTGCSGEVCERTNYLMRVLLKYTNGILCADMANSLTTVADKQLQTTGPISIKPPNPITK